MGCTQGQRQGEWEGKGVPSNSSRRSLRKGLWSPDEDIKLTTYIMRKGLMGCWNYIAKQAGLQRCGKSCRLRWINYLRPGLKRCAISPQEERLIIQLQSSLGNRWSQIAAHLPGRTDNEVKNYWNSAIKKKLMLKHHRPSSSTVATEKASSKPNFVFQSDRIRDEDSVSAHVPEVVTLSHSALLDLEVMPVEGYQRNNSTFNILFSTGENQVCARDVLELKQKAEDTNDEFLINPDPIHTAFISRYLQAENPPDYKAARQSTCDELILNSRRTIIPPHEVPSSAIKYLLDSAGFSIPALSEIQSSKEKIENDGQIIEKDTMIDYSSLTESRRISAWNAAHSNSNIGGDITEVYSGVSYTNEFLGTGALEDVVTAHHEKTASQSWQPLNLVAQVCAPLIGGTNNLYAENELMDRPNMSYDVPTYAGMSSSWRNNYKIEGGGIGDQQNCSRFPNEKANTKRIPPIFGGESGDSDIDEYYEGGADHQNCSRFPNEKPNTKRIPPIFGGESGASEIDEYYEGGAGQVPVWAGGASLS